MKIQDRLDAIKARVTAADFVNGKVAANEVPFFAFDYDPGYEPIVNAHVDRLIEDVNRGDAVKIAKVDLFELILSMLRDKGLYDKVLAMDAAKGSAALLPALKGPLDAARIAQAFAARVQAASPSVVFLTGVGAAYPLVRTHSLLNNLQPLMAQLPLVIFFPGRFSGKTLQLFGELQETSYYRAFPLVA